MGAILLVVRKWKCSYTGNIGDGPWNFNEQVIAWKFELSYAQPEIWVLSKQNNWIMLQSPKKSFKNIVRTILITVHWLHCVKQNPEASRKYIREQMLKVFWYMFL